MTLRLIAGGAPSPIAFPPFDAALDRTGRRQLNGMSSLIEVDQGHTLAREGDIDGALLVVASGVVKLWKSLPNKRRQIVAFRGPGEPISLHRRDTPWPVTAQAISDSKLYAIAWADLRPFARKYPGLDQALLDLASDEITSLQERLLMLGRKSTEEKIATFILEFCRPSTLASILNREVDLSMRRPEIADYLGLTTESVSREFSRLKRERIIAMPRPSLLVVLNRPALESTAFGLDGYGRETAVTHGRPAV